MCASPVNHMLTFLALTVIITLVLAVAGTILADLEGERWCSDDPDTVSRMPEDDLRLRSYAELEREHERLKRLRWKGRNCDGLDARIASVGAARNYVAVYGPDKRRSVAVPKPARAVWERAGVLAAPGRRRLLPPPGMSPVSVSRMCGDER